MNDFSLYQYICSTFNLIFGSARARITYGIKWAHKGNQIKSFVCLRIHLISYEYTYYIKMYIPYTFKPVNQHQWKTTTKKATKEKSFLICTCVSVCVRVCVGKLKYIFAYLYINYKIAIFSQKRSLSTCPWKHMKYMCLLPQNSQSFIPIFGTHSHTHSNAQPKSFALLINYIRNSFIRITARCSIESNIFYCTIIYTIHRNNFDYKYMLCVPYSVTIRGS